MTTGPEIPVVVGTHTERRGEAPEWSRKYPPLLAIVVALLIALAILPSALNIPQSNPTQTLEYAPVPPDDDTPPGDEGNLGSVGLGESPGVRGGGADGDGAGGGPLPTTPPGQGVNPNFRCVGDPPRQTEDPLAPPCVPFFEGDNFGATYQGVTAEEIRLLVLMDGGINHIASSDPSNRVSPTNEYFDLGEPPDPDTPEHLEVKGVRAWQTYFNNRFQTYGRRVHFYVYFTGCAGVGCTPEDRRQDAADNFAKVEPFAVISFATEGAEDDYLVAMARKGVLNFGSFGLRPGDFFEAFPKYIWSYLPSVEQQADQYVSYVCQKVVGRPTVLAGPEFDGRPRKLGMIYTSDPNERGLGIVAGLVKSGVGKCGGKIEAEALFPNCCLAQDNGEVPTYAQRQMADFRTDGITTILWPGGMNGNYGKSANSNGYVPEWIVLGDGLIDGNYPIRLSQNTAAFDGHAIVVTPQVLEPAVEQQRCYQAYREVDASMPRSDLSYVCDYYKNFFQFFVGVQVAGPRLGPSSIDQGFHAIPQRQTGEPTIPACFYLPGDYTCVKDAQAEIWDAGGRAPGDSQPGCWRAMEGGRRYLPGRWPAGNIDAQRTGTEPCNGFSPRARFNLA